jgi:glycine hydroxymethyltransferase
MPKTQTKQVNEMTNPFFTATFEETDIELKSAIDGELKRQQNQIELIASENIASKAVMTAQGSVFTNKYAEGYPQKRYYGGCEFADKVEQLAIDRVCKLFNAKYANVQPNSGSQANQAVFTALIKPGDTILGQSLAAGGHLTHGAAPNQSGKWFNSVQYGVRKEDGLINYDEIEELANTHKPKLLIGGFSAYPRVIDWARLRKIADSVNAYFLVDMAHIAGLVAAGEYPSPVPFADVVTSTTHKTLRGPRGGIIVSNFPDKVVGKTAKGTDILLGNAINSAIFPGIQGGPLVHVIAGKATAFLEDLKPEFKIYAKNIVENARVLAKTLIARGVDIVTGGTDNHIVLVDLRPKNLTGKATEESLERAGLTCNKNAIPFDPQPPFVTSGIRLGTPAGTTRGFGKTEFEKIGNLIGDVLDGLAKNPENNTETEAKVKKQVEELCSKFPIYNESF